MPKISSYALQYSGVTFSTIFNSTFDLFITEGDADNSQFIIPALTDSEVAMLRAQGRTIVGYVDVAVTDANRFYWQDSWTTGGTHLRNDDDLNPINGSAPAYLQNRPTNAFGILVDFTNSAWQTLVINQAVALVQRGYSGVFLDDVAAYDDTISAADRMTPAGQAAIRALATQMAVFVANIKTAIVAVNPNAFLVVNSDPYLHTNVTNDAAGAQAATNYLAAVDAHLLENQDAVALDYAQTSLAGETRLILELDGSPAYSYAESWARGILYTAPNSDFNSLGTFAYPATAGNDTLTGGDAPNQIAGLGGSDVIDGGLGADRLDGGGGDDFLYVDNMGDVIIEANGGGFDNVLARASYVLTAGAYVEILSTDNHAGTAAINLTGNELNNIVLGNAAANTLDGGGGAGADILAGFGGNDTYFVDANETVREDAGGGYDYVVARASFTLTAGAEVELLGTTDNAGTAAINLTGNEFANIILGNAGANTLNGGSGGADRLVGNGGDDTLFVDADDIVVEAGGGGYDYVVAKTSYSLSAGAEIELFGTTNNAGTSALNLTGNEFANIVLGNAGANVLNGGLGADRLVGNGGADSFAFTSALGSGNVDVITDFAHNDDKILLDHAVFGLSAGALGAGAFVTGSAAGDGDDRIIYNSTTGALLFDADGSAGGAAVQFATLQRASASPPATSR